MGSKIGALKVAAARLGMDFEEYMRNVNASLKWCWKCETWKKVEEFSRDASRSDGLKAICKSCSYTRKTGGPSRKKRREMRKKGFAWCRGCKEWLSVAEVSKGACRDCHNREARERYREDEEYRMERKQHAHSRKRGVDKIPVIGQQIILENFDGRCAYCGAAADTWDHVKPVSKGGKTVPYNIVPACTSCNSSKKDKDVFEWIEEQGLEVSQELIDRLMLEYLI
ncbi:MAG: HNH endonuclease [Anaerolineales bacterium]